MTVIAAFSQDVPAAPWTYVDLNPPGATASQINSTTGTQHAGSAIVGGKTHAFLWMGTSVAERTSTLLAQFRRSRQEQHLGPGWCGIFCSGTWRPGTGRALRKVVCLAMPSPYTGYHPTVYDFTGANDVVGERLNSWANYGTHAVDKRRTGTAWGPPGQMVELAESPKSDRGQYLHQRRSRSRLMDVDRLSYSWAPLSRKVGRPSGLASKLARDGTCLRCTGIRKYGRPPPNHRPIYDSIVVTQRRLSMRRGRVRQPFAKHMDKPRLTLAWIQASWKDLHLVLAPGDTPSRLLKR